MKISIITITFNSVKTIARTIESILAQNYPDLEYIIIDGASTDGTLDIVNKYRDKITKIISEPDSGISDAFNKGLKLATGEIIGIINSDDWYEPDCLARVAKEFNDSQIDFLLGALRYWGVDGRSFIVKPDRRYVRQIKYKMPHLNHPTAFFRKKVYEEIGGFNLQYKYAMDYDLFLRTFTAGKLAGFLDEVLANMSFAGVSDRQSIGAYRECLIIAPNKLLASLYFIYAVVKYYLRILLVFLGLDYLLNKIRRLKYNN